MLSALGMPVAVILACLAVGTGEHESFQTGRELRAALEGRMSVSWSGKPVREALEDLAAHLRVAVLLDRRIDPSLPLDNAGGERVRDLLGSMASETGAALKVVGNVVYLAPESTAGIVRTLIALRNEELNGLPASRAAKLRRPSTLVWNDLDRPDEILTQIAEHYQLSLEGLDRVPLDMWAGATLPKTSAAEQLTLVLGQFDLTFQWLPAGRGVRMVPIPESVELEREYPLSHRRVDVLAQQIRETIDGLETETEGATVRAKGTLEEHEQLAELLRSGSSGKSQAPPRARRRKRTTSEQRFTLRVEGASVLAVLELLETRYGFRIVVDKASLDSSESPLGQPVDVEVSRVTIEELLGQLLTPVGFRFEVKGRDIRVYPTPPG